MLTNVQASAAQAMITLPRAMVGPLISKVHSVSCSLREPKNTPVNSQVNVWNKALCSTLKTNIVNFSPIRPACLWSPVTNASAVVAPCDNQKWWENTAQLTRSGPPKLEHGREWLFYHAADWANPSAMHCQEIFFFSRWAARCCLEVTTRQHKNLRHFIEYSIGTGKNDRVQRLCI